MRRVGASERWAVCVDCNGLSPVSGFGVYGNRVKGVCGWMTVPGLPRGGILAITENTSQAISSV